MSYTVFVTDTTLHAAGRKALREAGCRVLYMQRAGDAGEVESVLSRESVDAVISRTVSLSARAVENCPSLKVVSKHGVGVSNIDVGACTDRGIPVFVTPGANAQSVAEMALGLLLAAARGIARMDGELRAGRWTRAQNGVELKGKTLGLMGYGQVARLVGRFALALGMPVLAYDPHVPPSALERDVEAASGLDALLRRADVLSLHVPLTDDTRSVIGAEQLALLPADAIVINTARGEVVDEPALIAALESGRLFAAGLDTMSVEPLPADSPLLRLPNVVLTPHVGGSTQAALGAMAYGAARNVLDYLVHGTLPADRVLNLNKLFGVNRS